MSSDALLSFYIQIQNVNKFSLLIFFLILLFIKFKLKFYIKRQFLNKF